MKELKPAAIYLCPGDPWNAPRGGQTAFAKQALNAFGSRFAIVSPRDGTNIPIGKWFVDKWQERPILHFNIGSYAPKNKGRLPLVPRRIVYRKIIQKYLQDIRELGVANLFLDSPELLGIVKKYDWN